MPLQGNAPPRCVNTPSGKTRLACEAAGRLSDAFNGAVWFVPLADISDPRLLVERMRDALQLPRSSDVEPLEQIVNALSRQKSLVVLDNLEHLIGKLGNWEIVSPHPSVSQFPNFPISQFPESVVLTLLDRIPTLKLLVTSRQRLDVTGEREFFVPPLPTPSGEAIPESLVRCESVQLFIDRAQAVKPDFQVTPANAGALKELCVRLEGVPLAIELAAARALLTDSLALWRQLDDARGIAQSLHFLGNVTNEQDDPVAARAFYEESQVYWRKLGNALGIAYSLMMMAQAVAKLDGRAAAYPLLEESLSLFRQADNKRGAAWALCTWAMQRAGESRERTLCRSERTPCRSLKDDAELRAMVEESLMLFREVGEQRGMTLNIAMLGGIALAQADYATARAFFQENLSLYRELGYQNGVAETLVKLAEVAMAQEQAQRAARLLGAAKSLYDSIGVSPSADHDRLASTARAALGDHAFPIAYAEGHALSLEQAIRRTAINFHFQGD